MPPLQELESEPDSKITKRKKRTLKRPWESVAMFKKGDGAVHDAEDSKEIKQLIYESAKKN